MDLKCKNPWAPTPVSEAFVRCRSCKPCRIHHQLQWYNRLLLEASAHDDPPFMLTLTYSPEKLPREIVDIDSGEVSPPNVLREVQLFFKRLRKAGCKVRYLCVTEKGTKTERLHHHAIAWVSHPSRSDTIKLVRSKWTAGHIWLEQVRGPKAFRYTVKYLFKDCLAYCWSNGLGADAIARWKKVVAHRHEKNPYLSWNDVPAVKAVVFGQNQAYAYIPENHFKAHCHQMGVPTPEPEEFERMLRLKYSGVPSGPVREDLVRSREWKVRDEEESKENSNVLVDVPYK